MPLAEMPTSAAKSNFYIAFGTIKKNGPEFATCNRSLVRIACFVKCHRLKGVVLIIHFCADDFEKKKLMRKK